MIKKILKITMIVLGIVVFTALILYVLVHSSLGGISKSNVDGNVPSQTVFTEYLSRDLTSYFEKKQQGEISVQYELLRNDPTQSGVAYPKYYSWVTISSLDKSKVVDEGAVRIAAIDKEYFQVTDFISKKEIVENPNILDGIFPTDVAEKIKQQYLSE